MELKWGSLQALSSPVQEVVLHLHPKCTRSQQSKSLNLGKLPGTNHLGMRLVFIQKLFCDLCIGVSLREPHTSVTAFLQMSTFKYF